MEIKINYRQIIVGITLIQFVFLGFFFFFFDILLDIPVNLGSAFMAISCVQGSMEKSSLSKSWNRGFLYFAVLFYFYFFSSLFLNYEGLFGFDLDFYLFLGSFSYMGLFLMLSHFSKKGWQLPNYSKLNNVFNRGKIKWKKKQNSEYFSVL